MSNTNKINAENKVPLDTNILSSGVDYKTTFDLISVMKKIFNEGIKNEETNLSKKEHDVSEINELIKNFQSNLNFQKIFLRIERLTFEEKGNENERGNKTKDNYTEFLVLTKIIKAYLIIQTWKSSVALQYVNSTLSNSKKEKNEYSNPLYDHGKDKIMSSILSKLNVSEISFNIYSLFVDELSSISINTHNQNVIDINPNLPSSYNLFLNLLLCPLLGESIDFKQIASIIRKNSNSESYQNFDIFRDFFKYILLFLYYSEKIKEIFDVLNKDKKSKILSAEFIVCAKKLKRSLEEDNIINSILAKMIELLNSDEAYITKTQFFNILLNSIVNL
jgi:hypothetical protein